MLQQLRRAAGSLVAKVLLALLVLSFALWGVGDVFRSQGSNTLASVGKTEISPQAFRNDYDRERQYIARRSGTPITNEQAENMGLRRNVLNQMLTEATFDEVARKSGIAVSNGLIAKQISTDTTFQNPQGVFDANNFRQLLQSNGYTEAMYVQERTQLAQRRLLAQSLTGGLDVPDIYSTAVNRLENEKRVVEYIVLAPEKFAPVAPPSEEAITAYYEDVKRDYNISEKREIKTLVLSPVPLAATITVADDDAQKLYDRNIAKYGKPEKRKIEQINFADDASAQAFALQVKANPNASLPNGATRSDLGNVTKEQLVDSAVRDVAFTLAPKMYSDVVKSSFGSVVLKVTELEPSAVTPFAEVKDSIKKEIALARARENILDLHDKVENERASGATLDEIASTLKLNITVSPALDRDGKDVSGKQVTNIGRDVLLNAFSADIGSDNEPVQGADKGWTWFEVVKIEPERERPLTEVRAEVVKQWVTEQQRIRMSELAKNLVAEIESGKTLISIAAEKKLALASSAPFKRDGKIDDFSPSAIDAAFKVAKNQAGTGIGANPLNRVVFVVKNSEVPPPAKLDPKLADNIEQGLRDDLLFQFVDSAQKDFGVSINQTLMDQMSSGTGL